MHARFAGLIVIAAVVLGVTSPLVGIAQVPTAPLPPIQVEVTGDPAPIEALRLAILTTVRAVVPEAMSGQIFLSETAYPMTYTVGGPLAMMSVGDDQDALRQSQTKTVLSGNYGVVYSFPVEVINPSSLPTILGFVMQAVGGQAGGTILIDDHIVDVPRVRSGDRRLVSTIHVAAGERRTVIISTMPESGANYPVRFTFGSQYQ